MVAEVIVVVKPDVSTVSVIDIEVLSIDVSADGDICADVLFDTLRDTDVQALAEANVNIFSAVMIALEFAMAVPSEGFIR